MHSEDSESHMPRKFYRFDSRLAFGGKSPFVTQELVVVPLITRLRMPRVRFMHCRCFEGTSVCTYFPYSPQDYIRVASKNVPKVLTRSNMTSIAMTTYSPKAKIKRTDANLGLSLLYHSFNPFGILHWALRN